MNDLELKYPHLDPSLLAALCGEGDDNEQIDHDMLERLNIQAMVEQMDAKPDADGDDTIESEDVSFLIQSFPDMKVSNLRRKLEKCEGNVDKAIDELLNQQLINDEGIDAYSQAFDVSKKKKRSQKTRDLRAQVMSDGEEDGQENSEKSKLDIQLIADTLNKTPEEAKELYARNGYSVAKTLVKFQPVVDESGSTPARPSSAPITSGNSSRLRQSGIVLKENIDTISKQREHAVDQLHDAVRKSKANHLFRSATGVYGDRARNLSQDLHEYENEMYTNRIEDQSNPYRIDCHGIPAKVAVTFVEQHLHRWSAEGSKSPLTIITGSGTHSSGGVPKIKNMIRTKLRAADYKYEEHSAYFVVIN